MSANDLPTHEIIKRLNAGKSGGTDPVKFAGICRAACLRLDDLSRAVQSLTETTMELRTQLSSLQQASNDLAAPPARRTGSHKT